MKIKQGDKIFKQFRGEVKGFDEAKKTIDVIVSTGSVDRDKEIILPDAFKKRLKIFKAHGPLLSSHNYHKLTFQIGKTLSIKVTAEGLRAKFEYFAGQGNEEADWAYYLASKDSSAFSIGFIPFKWEDSDEKQYEKTGSWRTYTDVELIEVSQVLVPSNRDAIQGTSFETECEKEVAELVSKGFESGKLKEFHMKQSPEFLSMERRIESHIKNYIENNKSLVKIEVENQIKAMQKGLVSTVIETLQTEEHKALYNALIFGPVGESPKSGLSKDQFSKLNEICKNAF